MYNLRMVRSPRCQFAIGKTLKESTIAHLYNPVLFKSFLTVGMQIPLLSQCYDYVWDTFQRPFEFR